MIPLSPPSEQVEHVSQFFQIHPENPQARLIKQAFDEGTLPHGTVRLLFQPSEESSDEENKSGARRMIEDGQLRLAHVARARSAIAPMRAATAKPNLAGS